MAFNKPGFFGDWSRHGLGAAWGKRFSSMTIGGQRYSYDQLLQLDWNTTLQVLGQAIAEGNQLAACYCFEGLMLEAQNHWACLQAIAPIVTRFPQETATQSLQQLLKYVVKDDQLLSSERLGQQNVTYVGLFFLPWNTVVQVLEGGMHHQNRNATRWGFEHLLIRTGGDFWRCWPTAVQLLSKFREPEAVAAMNALLDYVPNEEQLKAYEHGVWGNYCVGKAYLDQATAHRGSNKTEFLAKRKQAMHFLGNARKQVAEAQKQPAADPYRQAAMVAGVAALTAAAYETGFYMAYKGTRDATMTSSE